MKILSSRIQQFFSFHYAAGGPVLNPADIETHSYRCQHYRASCCLAEGCPRRRRRKCSKPTNPPLCSCAVKQRYHRTEKHRHGGAGCSVSSRLRALWQHHTGFKQTEHLFSVLFFWLLIVGLFQFLSHFDKAVYNEFYAVGELQSKHIGGLFSCRYSHPSHSVQVNLFVCPLEHNN